MQQLLWTKSLENKWLNLSLLNIDQIDGQVQGTGQEQGIYVIWHGGENPQIVRIGYGNIAQRLRQHKANVQITRFQDQGPLMVTWAKVSDPILQSGMVAYLSSQFNPLIKGPQSVVAPIAVMSPFS